MASLGALGHQAVGSSVDPPGAFQSFGVSQRTAFLRGLEATDAVVPSVEFPALIPATGLPALNSVSHVIADGSAPEFASEPDFFKPGNLYLTTKLGGVTSNIVATIGNSTGLPDNTTEIFGFTSPGQIQFFGDVLNGATSVVLNNQAPINTAITSSSVAIAWRANRGGANTIGACAVNSVSCRDDHTIVVTFTGGWNGNTDPLEGFYWMILKY